MVLHILFSSSAGIEHFRSTRFSYITKYISISDFSCFLHSPNIYTIFYKDMLRHKKKHLSQKKYWKINSCRRFYRWFILSILLTHWNKFWWSEWEPEVFHKVVHKVQTNKTWAKFWKKMTFSTLFSTVSPKYRYQSACVTIFSNIFYMLHYIRISQNFRLPFTWPTFVPMCNRKIDENLPIQYDIFSQDSFHFQSIKRDLIFSFWFGVKSMIKSKTSLSLR